MVVSATIMPAARVGGGLGQFRDGKSLLVLVAAVLATLDSQTHPRCRIRGGDKRLLAGAERVSAAFRTFMGVIDSPTGKGNKYNNN